MTLSSALPSQTGWEVSRWMISRVVLRPPLTANAASRKRYSASGSTSNITRFCMVISSTCLRVHWPMDPTSWRVLKPTAAAPMPPGPALTGSAVLPPGMTSRRNPLPGSLFVTR